jgi:hypothetical protein
VFPLLTLKLPALLHRSLHTFKLFAPDVTRNVTYYVIQYFNSCYHLLYPDIKKLLSIILMHSVMYSGRHIVRHRNAHHVELSKRMSNYGVRYFEPTRNIYTSRTVAFDSPFFKSELLKERTAKCTLQINLS